MEAKMPLLENEKSELRFIIGDTKSRSIDI